MRNKITKKNMDLDLRRYGKMLYSKAEKSGGSDDGGDGGGSTEVDYEAIYQFYKNKIVESIPEQYLEQVIIPEHYTDIELGGGTNTEYRGKMGIWYSDLEPIDAKNLFCEITTSPNIVVNKYIYFGNYKYDDK